VHASQVRRIYRECRRSQGDRVVVLLAPGSGSLAVVAARRVGGAVQRNRARRILREAWRHVPPQVRDTSDAVLVAREAIVGAKTQDLVAEMNQLLEARP